MAVVASAFAVSGAEIEVLSARQTTPGNVVVTIALPSAVAPKAGELALQLDDAPLVQAGSVTSLATPGGPAWLMLCIDRSGSIGQPVLDRLKVGLDKALVQGRPASLPFRVAIIAFATQPKHVLDFTSDPARVAASVRGLTLDNAPGGQTKLHDAIAAGLAALKAQGEGSKRLIVVSDGKDEGSSTAAEKLADLAQGPPRITIDALALGALAQDNAGAISSVAGSSGGRFLPSTDPQDVAQPLQRLIADAIRLSRFDVTFGYTPVADKRTTRLAHLQYTPEGGTQARSTLNAALVAQAVNEAVKPQPQPQPQPQPNGNGFTFTFEFVFNWLKNAPAALATLALALLAAAVGVWWYIRPPKPKPPEPDGKVVIGGVIVPSPPPPPKRSATAVGHAWQTPAPGQPVAILRGIAGTARGQMVPVDKALFRVGCDPDNDLILVGDDYASGAHALLRFEAGALYVEDVGSRNGTHLNGGTFKNATRALAPADELRFGRTTFQVLAPSQAGGEGRSGLEPSPD